MHNGDAHDTSWTNIKSLVSSSTLAELRDTVTLLCDTVAVLCDTVTVFCDIVAVFVTLCCNLIGHNYHGHYFHAGALRMNYYVCKLIVCDIQVHEE